MHLQTEKGPQKKKKQAHLNQNPGQPRYCHCDHNEPRARPDKKQRAALQGTLKGSFKGSRVLGFL